METLQMERDEKGRYLKGFTINPMIVNKYKDDLLFQHEVNEIKIIESAKNLSFLDRGKKYKQFKERWELSDGLVGKEYGKHGSQISRDIRLYEKQKEWQLNFENTAVRVMIPALEMPTKQTAELFLEDYQKYDIDFDDFVKLLKGTITPKQLIEQIKKHSEQQINEVQKFELAMLKKLQK